MIFFFLYEPACEKTAGKEEKPRNKGKIIRREERRIGKAQKGHEQSAVQETRKADERDAEETEKPLPDIFGNGKEKKADRSGYGGRQVA